ICGRDELRTVSRPLYSRKSLRRYFVVYFFCCYRAGKDACEQRSTPDARAARSFLESKQRALLGPVGRQARILSHPRFSIELLRLPTVDNCRGDVGGEPR